MGASDSSILPSFTMNEDSLNALHLDDLMALMVKSVNELLAMNKIPQNKPAIKAKQTEVELFQKVIWIKRGELSK